MFEEKSENIEVQLSPAISNTQEKPEILQNSESSK